MLGLAITKRGDGIQYKPAHAHGYLRVLNAGIVPSGLARKCATFASERFRVVRTGFRRETGAGVWIDLAANPNNPANAIRLRQRENLKAGGRNDCNAAAAPRGKALT
jgi:hypothetical protein